MEILIQRHKDDSRINRVQRMPSNKTKEETAQLIVDFNDENHSTFYEMVEIEAKYVEMVEFLTRENTRTKQSLWHRLNCCLDDFKDLSQDINNISDTLWSSQREIRKVLEEVNQLEED